MSLVFQGNIASVSGGSGTTLVIPVGRTVVVGERIIVGTSYHSNGVAVASIADDQGNTYAQDAIEQGSTFEVEVWSAECTTQLTTAHNITITYQASHGNVRNAIVDGFSGGDHAAPVDVSSTNTGAATSGNSGDFITTVADTFIYGFSMHQVAEATTPGGDFTETADITGGGMGTAAEYRIVSSTMTENTDFSWVTSGSFAIAGLAYRAAAVEDLYGASVMPG